MEEYDQSGDKSPYFGCTVGRVANRIGDSVFTLPDKSTHEVEVNCGKKDHLHGGYGWHRRQWTVVQVLLDQNSVTFGYMSKDGDKQFPGAIGATTIYKFV